MAAFNLIYSSCSASKTTWRKQSLHRPHIKQWWMYLLMFAHHQEVPWICVTNAPPRMNITVLIFGALSSHRLSLHHRCYSRLRTIPNLTTKAFQMWSKMPQDFHAMGCKPHCHVSIAIKRNRSQRLQSKTWIHACVCLKPPSYLVPRNKACRLTLVKMVASQRRWQRNASFIDVCCCGVSVHCYTMMLYCTRLVVLTGGVALRSVYYSCK